MIDPTATFTLSIETDKGTYMHGFHLGTDEKMAMFFAEEMFRKHKPKIGTKIVSVALIRGNTMWDFFDGWEWFGDIMARMCEEAGFIVELETPPAEDRDRPTKEDMDRMITQIAYVPPGSTKH